jgi:hypothetical protein
LAPQGSIAILICHDREPEYDPNWNVICKVLVVHTEVEDGTFKYTEMITNIKIVKIFLEFIKNIYWFNLLC